MIVKPILGGPVYQVVKSRLKSTLAHRAKTSLPRTTDWSLHISTGILELVIAISLEGLLETVMAFLGELSEQILRILDILGDRGLALVALVSRHFCCLILL